MKCLLGGCLVVLLYTDSVLVCATTHIVFMRGSRNFRQGGTGHFFFFFSPQLILMKSNG